MDAERWRRIDEILGAALALEAAERGAFLAKACGGDGELRREVESLLDEVSSTSDLDKPPADFAASLVADRRRRSMLGRQIGRYEILSLLGVGGMGEVYRAKDTRLGRDVAIKILPEASAANSQALARFRQETQVIAALSHPSILAIYDVGSEGELHYAVTELLEGETLRSCLSRGPLSWLGALEIALAIADALVAAHAKGVVHRDIKPANVFLTASGGVKILDFGIARTLARSENDLLPATGLDMTRPGALVGTVSYMSPEQVRGEPVGPPSDVFSLGCVLYEMVTAANPFARSNPAETMAAILNHEPELGQLRGYGVTAGVQNALQRCLAKFPSARLSAAELTSSFRQVVKDFHSTATEIPPDDLRSRPRLEATSIRTLRSWRRAIWLAPALIAAALATTLVVQRARPGGINSLAVLPLVNAGGENTEYLSDGVTEDLINTLSQLRRLRVIARPTAFRYKGKEIDARAVGRELDVQAVLTGRVTERVDQLTIQVELIDASNGSQLWGEQYQRQNSDLIAVQQDIAQQIAEKLRFRLTGDERRQLAKRYTENPEAYRLYLRGRFHSNKWTIDGFKKGIEYLNQAIELDPTYAVAYAGLAASYHDASNIYLPPNEAMPRARAAALTALKLDESLAEAHTALAHVRGLYEWNWAEAMKEYKRAIALNPSYADAYRFHGLHLAAMRRFEEAKQQLTRACELDPLTAILPTNLAWVYYLAGEYDEAIWRYQKLIAVDANFPVPHYGLALAYVQKNQLDDAIHEFSAARSLDQKNPFILGWLGHAYALAGKTDEAERILEELHNRSKLEHVDPAIIAVLYVGLGKTSDAFEAFEKAYQERSDELMFLGVDPRLRSLRSDPRFADLARRVGLQLN